MCFFIHIFESYHFLSEQFIDLTGLFGSLQVIGIRVTKGAEEMLIFIKTSRELIEATSIREERETWSSETTPSKTVEISTVIEITMEGGSKGDLIIEGLT